MCVDVAVVSCDSGHDGTSASVDINLSTLASHEASNGRDSPHHQSTSLYCQSVSACGAHDVLVIQQSKPDYQVSSATHDSLSVAPDVIDSEFVADDVSCDAFYDALETSCHTLCNGRVSRDAPVSLSSPTSSSSSSSRLLVVLSAVVLAVTFVVCGLLVLLFIILESDVEVSIVRSIRRLPEVCAFYRDHYVPWRRSVLGHSDSHELPARWLPARWPCVTHSAQGRKSHKVT